VAINDTGEGDRRLVLGSESASRHASRSGAGVRTHGRKREGPCVSIQRNSRGELIGNEDGVHKLLAQRGGPGCPENLRETGGGLICAYTSVT
jgi:hypothetical protein